MSKKINLEEIILDIYGCQNVEDFQKSFDISIKMVKDICKQACRQTLELAAEKVHESISDLEYRTENEELQQSILDTINQIE